MQDLLPWIKTEEEQIKRIEQLNEYLNNPQTNPFLNEKFVPIGTQFMDLKIVD